MYRLRTGVLCCLAFALLVDPAYAKDEFSLDDDAFSEDDEILETPEDEVVDFTGEQDEASKADEKKPGGQHASPYKGTLQVNKHSMTFGGRFGFTFDARIQDVDRVDDSVNPPETVTIKETDGGGSFTFAPEFGYFLIDQLQLLMGFGVNIPFGTATYDTSHMGGDTYRNHAIKEVFFDLGFRYLFELKSVYFYLGARGGMKWNSLYSILLSVPMGLLVPFNKHVALDVGLRFNMDIGVGDNEVLWIHIPMAYFGLQGFVNFFE